jgi:hypothetical protein
MATVTITQLPNSGALTGTEVLPIVQGNVTVQTTTQDVANLAGGGSIMAAGAGANSTLRVNNNNTASGPYSTVSGGQSNTIPEGISGVITSTFNRTYTGGNLNGTFSNISPTSTSSGLGSGATFYFEFFEGDLNFYLEIQLRGSNYVDNDTLTFNGTLFGGVSGTDNVTFQVNADSFGGSYSTIGGGQNNTILGFVGSIDGWYNSSFSGDLNGTFPNISPTSTLSGLGSGATFNFEFFEGNLNNINIQLGGSNYINGDTLTFNGTLFGGESGTDNVTLQISSSSSGGFSIIGGGEGNTTGTLGIVDNLYNLTYTGGNLDGTFSNRSPSSTLSGLGTGAEFEFEFIGGNLDDVNIQLGGSNYVAGDTLTFNGNIFGGESGVDDVTFQIETISSIGDHSTIGGGCYNTASGNCSTVSGGSFNTAYGNRSAVGGGRNNLAYGNCSTIGGGRENTISCSFSTIGGGRENTASGCFSTVSGGCYNTASGRYSTVGGGGSEDYTGNIASGNFSTVSGGGGYYDGNIASGNYSTVGGGGGNDEDSRNLASGRASTISGGEGNRAFGSHSTIGGGFYNTTISGYGGGYGGGYSSYSTIGGGQFNTTFSTYSTIGGGRGNSAGYYSTVGGGCYNTAGGFTGIITATDNLIYTGGNLNGTFSNISPTSTSSGDGTGAEFEFQFFNGGLNFYTILSGGSDYVNNDTLTFDGTLFGGESGTDNVTFQIYTGLIKGSTVGGGTYNLASGCYSIVGGGGGYGAGNTASGFHTGILGGRNNSTNGCNCAMIVGSCITAIATCTTHVNCLAIMDIPTTDPQIDCVVWNDNGILKISCVIPPIL